MTNPADTYRSVAQAIDAAADATTEAVLARDEYERYRRHVQALRDQGRPVTPQLAAKTRHLQARYLELDAHARYLERDAHARYLELDAIPEELLPYMP